MSGSLHKSIGYLLVDNHEGLESKSYSQMAIFRSLELILDMHGFFLSHLLIQSKKILYQYLLLGGKSKGILIRIDTLGT